MVILMDFTLLTITTMMSSKLDRLKGISYLNHRVKSIESLPKAERSNVSRDKPKAKKPFIEPGVEYEPF